MLGGSWASVCSHAQAYTIDSALSVGCHERITAEALRQVRKELDTAAPMPANRNERALIADLEFELDSDMQDLGAATLLIGVRDNDLKGRHSTDLKDLALVHGNPDGQREHCLRAPDQDEPSGSKAAVADCRAFIRERIEQALTGLDASGVPDSDQRITLPLYLTFRHDVDAELPTYYVRMGQALHTLEDSFTHAFRTSDGLRVSVALNWIDAVTGGLEEADDGPAHAGELDDCDDLDDLRNERRELATRAATDLLHATLDPSQSRAQKLVSVDSILDHYLSYSAGCTVDNDWCDAPERTYKDAPTSCSAAAGGAGTWSWSVGLGLVAAWRVKRRRFGRADARRVAAVALLAGLAFAPRHARAEASAPARAAPEPGARDPEEISLGGQVGIAGSVDYGALAAQVGGRVRLRPNWTLGLDAEWNPWIEMTPLSSNSSELRSGVFNGYATVIFRVPLQSEPFNLRVSASAGFSRLLMDLYGAPRGSTGIFAGVQPLGLEWKMSRIFCLVLNPIGVAVPVPQLKGVPFGYLQYRFGLAVEFYGP